MLRESPASCTCPRSPSQRTRAARSGRRASVCTEKNCAAAREVRLRLLHRRLQRPARAERDRDAREPLPHERHAARPVVVERRRQRAVVHEGGVGLADDQPVAEAHEQLVELRCGLAVEREEVRLEARPHVADRGRRAREPLERRLPHAQPVVGVRRAEGRRRDDEGVLLVAVLLLARRDAVELEIAAEEVLRVGAGNRADRRPSAARAAALRAGSPSRPRSPRRPRRRLRRPRAATRPPPRAPASSAERHDRGHQ